MHIQHKVLVHQYSTHSERTVRLPKLGGSSKQYSAKERYNVRAVVDSCYIFSCPSEIEKISLLAVSISNFEIKY